MRDDLAHAIRTLRRSPLFAVVTLAILTLGIGANIATFSVVNAVMLRRLPVHAARELVHFRSVYPDPTEPRHLAFPWAAYEHYRDRNSSFSDLIAVSPDTFDATGGLGVESIQGHYVSGNFFGALGLQPAAGRLIGPEDDDPGGEGAAVAVVSWTTWQTRFGGDPAIAGRRIVLDGVPLTIAGVAPRPFSGVVTGYTPAVFLPLAAETLLRQPSSRASGLLPVVIIGRLRPGTSIDRAQAEMRVLDRWRVEQMAQRSNDPQVRQITIDVEPAGSGINPIRDEVAGPLLVIMAAVGLLLLLACANVGGMLLARAASRKRELAVRVSLGAGPLRLVRQALAESLLLSVTGSVAGIFAGVAGARVLARVFTSGRPLPGLSEWTLDTGADLNVLLFTAAAGVLTGLLFGLAPAWHALRTAPMASLRDSPSATESRSRRLWGSGLVVAQVALSLVLLSAAALFAGHLSDLRTVNVGFEIDSVLLVSLDPARSDHQPKELSRLYQELLARLETIPAVRSATLSGTTPIHGAGASRFVNVEGTVEDPDARRYVAVNWVAPKYFTTFGTPLIAGRDFTFGDEASPVAIINQALARHYFGDESPLHRHFTFDGQSRRYQIVGVAGDAKYYNLHDPAPRTVYLNAFQDAPGRSHQFALRTAVPPLRVVPDVRRTVREALKNVAIRKVTTFEDQVNASLVNERLIAGLSATFGVLATLLGAVGLYGLLALTVSRRTNEIGIRMALGATAGDIVRLVLGSAVALVLTGLLLGAPLAFWGRRIAAGLIAGLPGGMAGSLTVAASTLLAAAALAAYVPARRAAGVDPIEALRHT